MIEHFFLSLKCCVCAVWLIINFRKPETCYRIASPIVPKRIPIVAFVVCFIHFRKNQIEIWKRMERKETNGIGKNNFYSIWMHICNDHRKSYRKHMITQEPEPNRRQSRREVYLLSKCNEMQIAPMGIIRDQLHLIDSLVRLPWTLFYISNSLSDSASILFTNRLFSRSVRTFDTQCIRRPCDINRRKLISFFNLLLFAPQPAQWFPFRLQCKFTVV